ncbi:transposase [Cohnella pontilimi]|uniref:Transposase n=1 Tax=Cohnella pontilimi TaxID=2564100 RepID=A0A4U0F2U8_9BACL|nr:transposase [Cohnella pontilimi]TJY38600.1 transposase [Cohnella pontilimi]
MSRAVSASDPTIYHYKLIRKITLRPESKYSYMATALIGASALVVVYGWMGLLAAVISIFAMLGVHGVVLKLTVRRIEEPWEKRFAFRRDWPWIGPLPVMDTNLALFRRLHFHLFLVGCCVPALFYPWAGSSWVIALLYWHFWMLAPRLTLLWRIRRERGDGVIRMDPKEVLYYHR